MPSALLACLINQEVCEKKAYNRRKKHIYGRKKKYKLQIQYNDYRCKYIVRKLCTWVIDM